MLMGVSQVSKEGKFTVKGDPKVMYTTMMLVRLTIIMECPQFSLMALKIALRYGTVRRQFATQDNSKEERRIIDYQTFQMTLVPLMAMNIANMIVNNWLRDNFRTMREQVVKGRYDMMPLLHHVLAGMKSQNTDFMMRSIETARRCCGGAGYQSNSGFTEIFQRASPKVTYEGDNIVMMLQSAGFVFKLYAMARQGKKVPFPFTYISQEKELLALKGKGASVDECCDMDFIERALAVRVIYQLQNCSKSMMSSKASQKAKDNELFARMKYEMTKAHMQYITLAIFRASFEKQQFKDARILPVMKDMYRIAGLFMLIENCSDCYASGFLAGPAFTNMKAAQDKLIAGVRPHLIPLIESTVMFEEPSNIGNIYGDCYELQLHQAKNSRINKLDVGGVPPEWHTSLKYILNGGAPEAKL